MLVLPLTNSPEESFNTSILDVVYTIRQLWNENGFWTLDIWDENGAALVYGVKIITQDYLLRQYPQIPFDFIGLGESDPGRYSLDEFQIQVVEKDV